MIWMVALAAAGLGAGVWAVLSWAERPGPGGGAAVLVVEAGSGVGTVARQLERRGVVDHASLFVAFARLRNAAGAVRAGEYRFAPQTTPAAALRQLVSGAVVFRRLQIVEGWRVSDMLAAVRAAPALAATLDGADAETLLARLGLGDRHAEGLFFPDTYHYVRADADADVLRRAFAKMQQVLATEWSGRDVDLPYANQGEALTMASIIEKETSLAEDRPRIAGVFVRRLARGMRLQTDPSVIYGLGAAFDGDLTRAHLHADGPYNTYRRGGLPPTPIALPGRAAIRAALHPTRETALYFVARGDGATVFSDTLREHNRAVRRFQLARR